MEPLNLYESDLINTVEQGLDFINEKASKNIGLLIDSFHANIAEKSTSEAIVEATKKKQTFSLSCWGQ